MMRFFIFSLFSVALSQKVLYNKHSFYLRRKYESKKQETIFRVGLEIPVVRDIFKMADENNVYVHTYSDEYILTSKDDEEIQDYRSKVSTPAR